MATPQAPQVESRPGTPVDRLRDKAETLKRGSKPGVKRGPYKQDGTTPNPPPLPPASVVLAPAFNNENFARVVNIPNQYMEFHTGIAGWAFTEAELKELSINGVPAFNEWIPFAPKWIHLVLFAISYISILFTKTLGYLAYLRDLARKREEDRKAKSSPSEPSPVQTPGSGPLGPTKTPPLQ